MSIRTLATWSAPAGATPTERLAQVDAITARRGIPAHVWMARELDEVAHVDAAGLPTEPIIAAHRFRDERRPRRARRWWQR